VHGSDRQTDRQTDKPPALRHADVILCGRPAAHTHPLPLPPAFSVAPSPHPASLMEEIVVRRTTTSFYQWLAVKLVFDDRMLQLAK